MALRYLFFTNECVGLGHLRRALTLAGAATERDAEATVLIVTGAPIELAHPLPPRVDTIKLPLLARDSVGELRAGRLGISLPDTRAVRSRVALAAAQSFRPEVAVVDKAPLGLAGELAPALEWLHEAGTKLVLGLRDIADAPARVRREWSPRVRAQLEQLYDAVLVYGPDGNRHDALACLGLNTELPVHHVGYIASRPADRPTDLPEEYVLVTAGGGADDARLMATFLDALELEPLPVPGLVVTGPLMPEAEVRALRARARPLNVVVETFRPGLDGVMAGSRGVVAMAGYNTVSELLRTGCPALLVPRIGPSHEQALRAELLRESGRAQVLYPHELEPHRLRSELSRLLATPAQHPRPDDGEAARAGRRPRGARGGGRGRLHPRGGAVNARERAAVRVLSPFLTRHWRALAVSAASTVVLTLAQLAQPWPLKIVIDRLLQSSDGAPVVTSSDLPLLLGVTGLVIAIAAVDASCSYWSDVLLNRAGERIAHDLRVAVYAHLQRLSLGFHDRRPKGDLVSRVTGDVNAVGSLFSDSLGQITSAILLLAGMAAVSFLLDPILALATFAVTPLLGLVTFRYRRRIKDLSRLQRAEEGEIASLATEALSAIQVVKAFGSEEYEYDRVHERSELRRRIGVDAARAQARFSAVVDLLGAVAAALVLVLGVFRVSSGALTPGSLVVFATYAARTYKPLRDLARQSSAVSRAGARAERIAELLATDDALRDRPNAYTGPPAAGALEFENVSFAYTPDRPALRDVELSLAPGQRVAIVGRSGAGKSTLAALIARFYDPDTGTIHVDGRDARDCALVWLREQVGILLQDTVLFRGSVADNIAYGSTAGRAEIVAAARSAGAHEFVSQLPAGYDTELGAGGTGLSGGQRQRLGIARVLLRDPPILVLDEPTTGLDAASEARVVAALERLMEGRTTLIVTHSIALAQRAGRVLVVEDGRIVEDGTPDDLVAARGAFSNLAGQQQLGRVEPVPRLRDPRLPQLAELLDADGAASVLVRTLRPGSELAHAVPRAVTYKPGRRLVVTYDALVDGVLREAVIIADTKRDLAAVAAHERNVAAARGVDGRSPVELPLRFDPDAGVLVQWLPYDLELPLLREPPPELAARLAALGLAADPAVEPRRLGYTPLHRVVLGVGGHVVKGYASWAKFAAAADGLRFAQTSGLPTAVFEARLDDLGATVQSALPGSVAIDDTRLAPVAGALLRELHERRADGLRPNGPDRQLRAAAGSSRLVAAVLPELESRTVELVARLEDALPTDAELVCSHGDFEVGQLLEDGDDVALLDFDELCAAPRALDVTNYGAHAARRGGSAAALAVTDAVLSSYGPRPDALAPYLAAAILIRAQAPFRKLEDDWPARVEALVTAAEDVLA